MSALWPVYLSRDLPLSADQRRAIHRDAWKLWWRNRWNLVVYLMLPAVFLAVVPFASDLAGRAAGAGGLTLRLARASGPIILFAVCFVAGGAILQRYRFAPCVYRAARRHGHDLCTRCGYWLRGLPPDAQRCPECGATREPLADEPANQPPP